MDIAFEGVNLPELPDGLRGLGLLNLDYYDYLGAKQGDTVRSLIDHRQDERRGRGDW